MARQSPSDPNLHIFPILVFSIRILQATFEATLPYLLNEKRTSELGGAHMAFSLFRCDFLEGPTLDPLAPAQPKRNYPSPEWPQMLPLIISICRFMVGYLWKFVG